MGINENNKVDIVEVGPRDGLQNESTFVETRDKFSFIKDLYESGLTNLEVTSFVRPDRIPQMKDAAELTALVDKHFQNQKSFWYLVPNIKGLERAGACGAERFALFTATSESFNQKNINASVAESLDRLRPVLEECQSSGAEVRGYISTAFGCPYEGDLSSEHRLNLKKCLNFFEEFSCVTEISLGDTIGSAYPALVKEVIDIALGETSRETRLAMHFHDTRGLALANVLQSLEKGIRTFDSSAGGLGGCPYAKGASGNVATEEIVALFHRQGLYTGINLKKLTEASAFILGKLGRKSPSKWLQAYTANPWELL